MSFLVGEVFSKIFRLRSTDPRLHHLKLGRMTSWRHLTMQETPAKSMFQVSTPKILSLTQKSPQRHVPSYIKHLLDEFRRSPPLTSEPKGRMKPLNITSVTDSGSTGPTKRHVPWRNGVLLTFLLFHWDLKIWFQEGGEIFSKCYCDLRRADFCSVWDWMWVQWYNNATEA